MARYNAWQNRSVLAWAGEMTEEERLRDRGAFWGSVMGTLNHLLWGDTVWMHRLAGGPNATCGLKDSPTLHAVWAAFCDARAAMDQTIQSWTEGLTDDDLAEDFAWSSASAGRSFVQPKGLLALHFFNHQTHHRGQLHAMATAAGLKPGATDLPFMEADG